MKKILAHILALVLCLTFACPAFAQDSYVIGQPTKDMLLQAFLSGKQLTSELSLGLDFDAQALGLSQEESAQLTSVLALLDQATLTSSVVKLDDALRIELGGELENEAGDTSVGVTAAAELSFDGLCLESDLFAGRRVSIQWETLLALCGADSEMITTFTQAKDTLRTMDAAQIEAQINALLTELVTTLQPILETIAQVTSPYMTTITEAILTLPIEMHEVVNEDEDLPTVSEICITATPKDIANLFNQLADQAAQDAALQQVGNLLLSEAGADVSMTDIIASMREVAAHLAELPGPTLNVYVGMDKEDVPVSVDFLITNSYNETACIGIGYYNIKLADEMIPEFHFYVSVCDSQGNLTASFKILVDVYRDSNDPNTQVIGVCFSVADAESLMKIIYNYTVAPKSDSELPTYKVKQVMNLTITESESEQNISFSSEGVVGMTAAGGESSTGTSEMEFDADGLQMSMTSDATMQTEPTADGNLVRTHSMSESFPAIGLNNLALNVVLVSEDYTPSTGLESVAVETMSEEQLQALVGEVYDTLTNVKLMQLINVLPQDLLDLLFAA